MGVLSSRVLGITLFSDGFAGLQLANNDSQFDMFNVCNLSFFIFCLREFVWQWFNEFHATIAICRVMIAYRGSPKEPRAILFAQGKPWDPIGFLGILVDETLHPRTF